MKVIFLGCGYLSHNLSILLKNRYQTQVWGIDSPYVSMTPDFQEVNAFEPDAMSKMDFRGAIVVDGIGLVANNARSADEEELLLNLENRYRVLLRILQAGGMKKFVFFSSGGTVYGPSIKPISELELIHPETLYAKSKVRIEEVIQKSGVNYLILRVANPFGGYQEPEKRQGVIPILIRKAYTGDTFEMWVDSRNTRDYLYITDFARALQMLLEHDVNDEIVNIGSGIGTSMDQVFKEVENSTGRTVRIEHRASEVPLVESIVLDISKLKQLTGFQTEISFAKGVRLETERIKKEMDCK